MGVVQVQQGKPTPVQALDGAPLDRFFRFAVRGMQDGLYEAVELRRMLEPPIARLAAERRDEADLAELDLILVRLESALGDLPRWIEADLDFHAAHAADDAQQPRRPADAGARAGDPRDDGAIQLAQPRAPTADWRQTYERHVQSPRRSAPAIADAAEAAMQAHFEAAEEAVAEISAKRSAGRKSRGGKPT